MTTMGSTGLEITINVVKTLLVFLMMVQAVPILVWLERRGSAFIQNRFGPNRVGPLGLLQLLADAVKFLMKEETIIFPQYMGWSQPGQTGNFYDLAIKLWKLI